MPTYISLMNWTNDGIKTVKDAPSRLTRAREALKAMGGELKAIYLVTGKYDFVVILEAPDDETVARFSIASGMQGSVRTETMRAFTEEEYRKIVGSLP